MLLGMVTLDNENLVRSSRLSNQTIMSPVPQKAKRHRAIIHRSGGSSHASRHPGIITLTPVRTRRGKTTYEEVPAWQYYRASSSEDETPTRKRIKSPRGADGGSNLFNEVSQLIDEQDPANFLTSVRQKTKVKIILSFSLIDFLI